MSPARAVTTIARLRQQINGLIRQQVDALTSAIFISMTRDQAQAYKQRSNRLRSLTRDLALHAPAATRP